MQHSFGSNGAGDSKVWSLLNGLVENDFEGFLTQLPWEAFECPHLT